MAYMNTIIHNLYNLCPKTTREELDIDLADIMRKLRLVMLPRRLNSKNLNHDLDHHNSTVSANDADFWGPLFVVLFYSTISVYGQFSVCDFIFT